MNRHEQPGFHPPIQPIIQISYDPRLGMFRHPNVNNSGYEVNSARIIGYEERQRSVTDSAFSSVNLNYIQLSPSSNAMTISKTNMETSTEAREETSIKGNEKISEQANPGFYEGLNALSDVADVIYTPMQPSSVDSESLHYRLLSLNGNEGTSYTPISPSSVYEYSTGYRET